MKILVINGPNLNMLGQREKYIYGTQDYTALCNLLNGRAKDAGAKIELFQTNHEGEIIDKIQDTNADAIIINAGGYTHTSVSIRDALSARCLPAVEVHISNIYAREEFRQKSLITGVCTASVIGMGFEGYIFALDFLVKHLG